MNEGHHSKASRAMRVVCHACDWRQLLPSSATPESRLDTLTRDKTRERVQELMKELCHLCGYKNLNPTEIFAAAREQYAAECEAEFNPAQPVLQWHRQGGDYGGGMPGPSYGAQITLSIKLHVSHYPKDRPETGVDPYRPAGWYVWAPALRINNVLLAQVMGASEFETLRAQCGAELLAREALTALRDQLNPKGETLR